MDMLKKINKGVGMAATAMIIAGTTPQVVHAIPNKDNVSKVEAKAICKDLEKSIKNGTFKSKDLSKNIDSDINKVLKKDALHEMKFKVLQENSNDNSMAGTYIKKVEHEVTNGKHYLVLSLDSIDWMKNIKASIDSEEKDVKIVEKHTKKVSDGKGKEEGKIRFEIKDLNSKILMHMNVEPMGNARVTFRVVLDNGEVKDLSKTEHNKKDIQNKEKQKKDNNKQKDEKQGKGEKESNLHDDKESKKDKTNKVDEKSGMKWGKVSTISEVTSVEFGKFYGGFDKYRIGFKDGIYNPNMKIYVEKFEKIIVNNVEYIRNFSSENSNTFYFGASGLDLNPSAFKEGENVLIFKSKGYNDLRLSIKKNGEKIQILKQEESISEHKESNNGVNAKPKHNIENGIYTIGFKTYKVENAKETSMLGGFLDPNVKVEVKDGKIKLTFLHKVMADMLIDFRFESNGEYIPAKLTYYENPKGKTADKMKTLEVEVSDLTSHHKCGVLVTAMGGRPIDIGNIKKYRVADMIFSDKLVKGWKGFEEKRAVKTKQELFNDALVSAHLDKNHDGIVTDEEISLARYEIELDSKGIKDISRLKNLGSKVTGLDLRANEIAEIKEGTFDNAVNLEKLLLNCNEIESLPSNIFDKLTKLKTLDISENNFKKLPGGIFKNLKNLEELSIRECNLEELPDGIFKNLKNLRTLSLGGNKLSHIPKGIFDLSNLESLYINENMLEEIPNELSELKKLKTIQADHNFINKIGNKFFRNIRKNKNIKILNIKDNELKELPEDIDKIFNFNGFDSDVKLNNVKNMPKFKESIIKNVYPQKSFTDFNAEVKGNKITWKSDLSILDMLCWERAVNINSKDIKNVKKYKEYLASKNAKAAQDILQKDGLMWEVVTDIQRKDANGKYVTIKTFKSKEDNNSGSYEESSIDEKNQYRVLKRVYGNTFEEFSYLLGQMAEVKGLNQNTSKEVIKNKIKDGVYSVGFTAYKLEDKNETSMLNNFFDKKAKLEVKDGKMKITLLNICFAEGVYDFRIESNGEFTESIAKGYGKLNPKGNYPFKTFEINISNIDLEHEGCVLVGPMGGLISDIGNFDKYRKVMFVFDRDKLKEWNGFDEDHKVVNDDIKFNKALLGTKLDKDGDEIVTNEELAIAEGEVNLARKEIKDISRLQFLGKNVTALDLTGNEIVELPKDVFNNLTKLTKLDIHGNYIKKLPEGIFDKLTELTELYIGMNEFKELPKGIFDRLTKLKKLGIYNTTLNNIDDNLFNNLKNLEYLSLEETGISKIPQGIFKLVNLKTLNLNKNDIRVIPKELANLKNLTWLDLGTNYIEEIPDEVYENLNKLTMFEVKDNQLTKIPLNIWDLIPESNRMNCSFNKLGETPKLPDPSKGKKWLVAYPQKQALNLKLNAKDGEVTWTQDISSVDLIAWWRLASSFNTKKVPETLDEYKKQLGNKTALEFLLKGSSEPQIITKIQKKDIRGNYKTIKEIKDYNKNDHSDKFKDPNMKNGDEYRILKRIGVVSYGSETYVCTDVAYTKAKISENHKKDITKPIISTEKPAIYEAKVTLNSVNEESKKIINKYLDLNKKIDVEVKNKEVYMTLTLMSKREDIKKLQVDGNDAEFEVVEQYVPKQNRLAAVNAKVPNQINQGKESTTIKFKIPNEKAKVKVIMNDKDTNKDESFEIKLKEDTIKEVSNISKPVEKPSTTATSTSHKHHSHKHHRKESKEDDEVKPSEEVKDNKEDKKENSKEAKDTNVKEDKNNDFKPSNNIKDNDSKDKKDKKDNKDNNVSEQKESNDIKKDSSKEVTKETKNSENKVSNKEKPLSSNSTKSTSNKKSTEIKEKKLPQTGMPFGSGLLGAIGSAITGLGVILGRKNRKDKK